MDDFYIMDADGELYYGGAYARLPATLDTSPVATVFLRSLTVIGVLQLQYPFEGSGENA